MAHRIYSIVEPELLIWARTSIGLSIEEAARKARIEPARLKLWEAGEAKPTISQLRKLAAIYKRPLAVFFLPQPPNEFEKTFDAMRDFRRLTVELEKPKSTALRLELRKARERREVVLDLSGQLSIEIPTLEQWLATDEDPEEAGARVRELLLIDIDEQREWSSIYQALSVWRSAVETLGVLVFQTGQYHEQVEIGEMRGCSVNVHPLPIIILNGKDQPAGRIFTLIHELVHLQLGGGALCDLEEYWSPISPLQRIEAYANHVAGAALVPLSNLLNEPVVRQHGADPDWSNSELAALAGRYRVSQEVILRRLLIAGVTNEEFYRQRREKFLEEYDEIEKQESSGFAPYYKLVINRHGRGYVTLMLNAYYEGVITTSALSGYLGAKLKHVAKIEQDILGHSAGWAQR